MLDDVADVETVARPAAQSPDTKAAVRYLGAAGAVAITITSAGTIRSGSIRQDAVATFWIMTEQARAVAAGKWSAGCYGVPTRRWVRQLRRYSHDLDRSLSLDRDRALGTAPRVRPSLADGARSVTIPNLEQVPRIANRTNLQSPLRCTRRV